MTAQQYSNRWQESGETVLPLNKSKLSQLPLNASTIAFLEIGLPQDAAPYLSFVNDSDDLYKGIAWLDELYEGLDLEPRKYVVIGSDGSGDPIAINVQQNDVVEWLDHEDDFAARYCNKTLESLLSFLLIYRDFVNELIRNNGPDAFLNSNFTDEEYNFMKQRMLKVDSVAVNQPGFWSEDLNNLLANRDYERLNP
jgi:hypothetical protein